MLHRASLVLLGASALFANGSLLSRAGTAIVAMLAKEYRVPVVVAVETYKFADVTRLDGLGSNEVVMPYKTSRSAAYETKGAGAGAVTDADREIGNWDEKTWGSDWAEDGTAAAAANGQGRGEKSNPNLTTLALLYDLTPADCITALCTEVSYFL